MNRKIEIDEDQIQELPEEQASKPEGEQPEQEEPDEMKALQEERDEYFDRLLRKQAEFENYKKRIERDKEELRRSVRSDILTQLLPIVDACETGLESMRGQAGDPVCDTFIQGYELLLKQLQSVLERYDVKEVPGRGSAFDPNLHEAVVREITDDHEENEIVEEYRKGYLIGDRLLRPSQVKVAVAPEDHE